ncbi:MAG TPA: hypothetical protein DIU05_09090, partial [Bacteroidetes bacterium]|nr:hypothetical protein [Bacteroidota bacterium]
PLKYTDPDGNEPITISAIVIGMAYGAIIGAGTSAAVYTSSSLAMGNFNVNDLGKASLMGAIGGAVGGGLGAGFAGSAFGQSIGFGVLKTTTANVAGNLALGNKMTVGSLVGSIAGGILYGSIPGFTGVAGGSLKNGMMEMIHNTSISGVTGGVSGIIGAGIDGKDMAAAYDAGIVAGALGGAVSSGLMVSIFGSAVIPSDNVRDVVKKYNSQSNNNSIYAPVFRRGGLYGLFSSRGVTWGRNLVVPQNDQDTYTHEYIHYLQAIKQGFGNMQMKGIYEQTKYIINGENWNPYYTKGTNEYYAEHPKEFFRLYKH